MTAGENNLPLKKQSTLFSFFQSKKPSDSSETSREFLPTGPVGGEPPSFRTDQKSNVKPRSPQPPSKSATKRTRVEDSDVALGDSDESLLSPTASSSDSSSSDSSSSDTGSSSSEIHSPDAKKPKTDAPSVDVEKLFIFHSQSTGSDSQEFLTPIEPPSIRKEFRVNMKSAASSDTLNEPILSVEEIDKLCKNVPPFVSQFTHLYFEYCNRFDFPSWYNPKNLKDKNMRSPTDPEYDVGTLHVPRRNGKVTEDGHSTPMLQQYWDIKQDHFNEIILFKVGKFYELFYIDAAIAQSVCNLKWMGHDRRAHVGFPEVSLQHHASLLIDQGYTVCVVEQTETVTEANERSGKSTGALVERKICEVFTTGTLIHDNMLSNSDAHYIAAIYMSGSVVVAIVGDCSTGRFTIHQVTDLTNLKTLLFTFSPKEIIFQGTDDLTRLLAGYREMSGCVVSRWIKWEGNFGLPKEIEVSEQVRNFVSTNPAVNKCVSGIINYLDHLLLREQVTMCSTWELVDDDSLLTNHNCGSMILDATVLSHLEILRDSENSERGSLLKFLNQTKTKFGSRMMRKWICSPLTKVEAINARFDAVEFFIKTRTSRKIFESLGEFGDLERWLQRICAQALQQSRNAVFFNEVENKRISSFLSFLDAIGKSCNFLEKIGSAGDPPALIQQLTNPAICSDIRSLCESLKSSIYIGKDNQEFYPKPGVFADYDNVLDKIKVIENELKMELDRVRNDVIGSNEPVFVSVKFRYEMEVPIKYEKIVKDNLYEITSGRKGYVRFLTDNVKLLVAKLETAEQEKKDLLYPFMSKLFSEVNKSRFMFNALIQRLAELDCLHALAIVSNNSSTPSFVRPTFGLALSDSSSIRLIQSRHPVQEHLMQLERDFVPNDIIVDSSTLLVTGANMGGKSTILRQICVNVIMAQMGCFVPASECFISQPIDRIFTRIGASDNILEGKSTFLTELEETATILQQATKRSLVVIDELGRGTSTFDGVAIAGATLDHITNQIGCNCLFATHYHKLCTDENVEKMKNRAVHLFHMECKSNGSEIELTHKFVPGSYPHSQAMHVARIAGIPESILQEAEKVSLEFLNSITGA